MRITEFFEEENGQLSIMRIYGLIALFVAALLTFKSGSAAYDLILTWLIFAFGGKTTQKGLEIMANKKVGK